MTRRCTVCDHPQHWEINRAMVRGSSLRAIAAAFSVSHMAAQRHKRNHLAEILAPHAVEVFFPHLLPPW